jgi:hypothetical protein
VCVWCVCVLFVDNVTLSRIGGTVHDGLKSASSPPPRPAQKTHPQPTQKRLPIKTSSSPMRYTRGRFPEQSPSTNELCGSRRGFVSGTNKRPRVNAVKNTHLKPSCHHTMGQDYPLTHPSPGTNPSIYPFFPALT